MPDQAPGKRFFILAEDLPAPYSEPARPSGSQMIARDGRMPLVPEGFGINLFAQNIDNPRHLLALSQTQVLVSQQQRGEVMVLDDADADGTAGRASVVVRGMDQPYGLAMVQQGEFAGDVLIADVRGIWRLPLASGGDALVAVTGTGVFGTPRGHITRSLAIHPETGEIYSGVGSISNIDVEPAVKASIQLFDPDGSNQRTFASGMRNPTGIGFHPETGKLWSMVQERDGMGDNLVPDYFTEVEEGDFFGWPYAYSGGFPQPQFAENAPEGLIETTRTPSVLFTAHSSAMDFVFVPDSWPEDWQGDAIAALRGSWNRNAPTGYKLVRVLFEDGEPTGAYENFVTGFWVSGTDAAEVWGRPSNLGLLPDGSLLVADDPGGTIWRTTPPQPD